MRAGKNIRKRRKAMGLSLKQFAKKYGCKHPYICAVESGRRSLTIETLEKFARVLKCKVRDLL